MTEFRIAEVAYMASDDIMTAGAGGATATVRADIKAAFFDIDGTLTSFVTHVIPQSSIDAPLEPAGIMSIEVVK